MSEPKHFLYISNPAPGEMNTGLAMMRELLSRGHRVTILSASSFRQRFEAFRSRLPKHQAEKFGYVDGGSGREIGDYTPFMQGILNKFRSAPGGDLTFLPAWEAAVATSLEDSRNAIFAIKKVIEDVNPDVTFVDTFCAVAIDATRATGRPWIVVVPCGPSVVASPDFIREPAGLFGQEVNTWTRTFQNVWLVMRLLYYYGVASKRIAEQRKFRYEVLKFPKIGLIPDSFPCPPVAMVDTLKAALVLQPPGFNLYLRPETFDRKCFFVGAIISEEVPTVEGIIETKLADEIKFLDDAHAAGADVVYINFGSIFCYSAEEYHELLSGMEQIHDARPNTRFLWKVPRKFRSADSAANGSDVKKDGGDFLAGPVPLEFVMKTNWVQDVTAILKHPATKITVHHGGGNSTNESLAYEKPQLVFSQWTDCHELGRTVHKFGVGRQAENLPHLTANELRRNIVEMLEPSEYAKMKASAQHWALRSRLAGGASACASIAESVAASS